MSSLSRQFLVRDARSDIMMERRNLQAHVTFFWRRPTSLLFHRLQLLDASSAIGRYFNQTSVPKIADPIPIGKAPDCRSLASAETPPDQSWAAGPACANFDFKRLWKRLSR